VGWPDLQAGKETTHTNGTLERVSTLQATLQEVYEQMESVWKMQEQELDDKQKFEFWLNDLAGRSDFQVRIITVDHTKPGAMAYDNDESYDSKGKCQKAAESRVKKAYNEAERKMNEHFSDGNGDSVYASYIRDFDNALDRLRKLLQSLRTPATAEIIDEIGACLTASGIHKKARQLSGHLKTSCHLDGLDSYITKIRYDVNDPSEMEDPGLFKLIAKGFTRYGFETLDVSHSVERDAREKLNALQNDFNSQIHEEVLIDIVGPVQKLLPRLKDALDSGAA
jgi:hypothetical protein